MSTASAPPSDRFHARLAGHGGRLSRHRLEVLQANVGRLCNQTCRHCHVNAGPTRTELMSEDVADHCIRLMDEVASIHTLDITGGAPELSPVFRRLALAGRARGKRVIDRCNLTVLMEPGQEDLAAFLRGNGIDIIASLPCYTAENTDRQRGDGVFAKSIAALRLLNGVGYGVDPAAPRLDLVYNPGGPGLPPPQAQLEADYRERLRADFGVAFTGLLTITNMPIGRFRSDLHRQGRLDAYLDKLDAAFNPATLAGLMCRSYLSVDHEGWLYDCDFNQMLDLGIAGTRRHIADLAPGDYARLAIATAEHCLGCTAGAGSSCGGALA